MKVIVRSVIAFISLTTVPLVSVQTSAASTSNAECMAVGSSLKTAKANYRRQCDLPRKDCDPINGEWMCSSHVIGRNSPSGPGKNNGSGKNSQPANHVIKNQVETNQIKTNRVKTMVLNLVGTGNMYIDVVPDAEIPGEYVNAWCFDLDLIDMRSGKNLGQATDCLDNSRQEYALSESGIAMIGTTYFNLPGGMLAIQGRTTVQPRNWPTREFTHITGGNSAGNAVLYGTGRYKNAAGTARLSGMVDLSKFRGQVGDPISFDCIFVVDVSY